MATSPRVTLQDVGISHLFWTIRDAVVVADAATGQIVLWNPVAETLFGYGASEIIGLPLESLMPERLREAHRAGLARYQATGHGRLLDAHVSIEAPAVRKSGDEITIEVTLTPVKATQGAGQFVLAIVREVAARLRVEEGLRRVQEQAAPVERRVRHDRRTTPSKKERLATWRMREMETALREAQITLAQVQVALDQAQAQAALVRASLGTTQQQVDRVEADLLEQGHVARAAEVLREALVEQLRQAKKRIGELEAHLARDSARAGPQGHQPQTLDEAGEAAE